MWGINGNEIHNDVFDQIISLDNLFLAWREFKRGKTKKLEVQEFELSGEDNLFRLRHELKTKTYQHSDYTAFYVKDPKLRHIHKADVRDRVLHHAIFRVLYPIFDKHFIHDSYSCRLDKGTHKAVDNLEKYCRKLSQNNQLNIFTLKCDVRKFFDSIDQNILLKIIKNEVEDENAIWLIQKIIVSFEKSKDKGLPLGNVTSQLFSNIYLNELDQFVKHKLKIKYYVRYCDDFIVLSSEKNGLIELAETINSFLGNNLGLSLHPGKIVIRKWRQGIDFLGYVTMPYRRVLRTKTKNRIFTKINDKNIQSYLGILKHCNGYKIEQNILKMTKAGELENLKRAIEADKSLSLYGAANLVFGEGNPEAEVMFIGEAPGFHENKQMRPFVGLAGKLLNKLLAEIKWPRESIYITNIVKRRPPKNRDPLPKEIKAYGPYLKKQIKIINPKIIAPLGRFAMNYFLPTEKISQAHGKAYTLRGKIILPLYHPAAALRSTAVLKDLEADFKKLPILLNRAVL